LAPGPNVMFIMSQAALRGHRAGLMAGFGVQVANVLYFALTAQGRLRHDEHDVGAGGEADQRGHPDKQQEVVGH
ncbi:MAG: hypothetical protein EON93_14285, partial [Burkholderiales bacterium]